MPSRVPSAVLVRPSLVPSVHVASGEGERDIWWSSGRGPPSGGVETSRLRGSDSSPNETPGCDGTTRPVASSNRPSLSASAADSLGSKAESGGPLTHSGGS